MKQEPRIVHSELTDQWYIVTRYSVRHGKDKDHALLVAHKKYDVTEQMKDILRRNSGYLTEAEQAAPGKEK
jgi:hypothetical protein